MPTIFGDAYTQPMMDRFGVPVTVGAVTARGIRDEADERVLEGQFAALYAKIVVLRVRRGTFPALAVGVSMTIDGIANLKALEVANEDDGGIVRVVAVKVL